MGAGRSAGLGLRLALLIALAVFLTAAGGGAILFRVLEEGALREAAHGADRFSEALRSGARYAMLRNQRDDLAEIIRAAGAESGVEVVRVINKAGEVVFSSRSEEVGSRLDLEAEACVTCHAAGEPLVAPEGRERMRVFSAPGSKHRNIGFITPVYNEPSCSAADCHAHPASRKVLGVIDLQVSIADIDAQTGAARRTLAGLLALWVPLVALIFGLGGHMLVGRPVRRLADACRSVAERGPELSEPLPIEGAPELKALAAAFNTMHAELSDAHRAMQERITDGTLRLKDAEEQILRREKLSAVGVLAAGIAHEVNNPITGIMTFSHLMLREAEPGSEAEARLRRIIGEAERCARIIRNFLNFSRPGDRMEIVEPRKAVEAVVSLLEPQPLFRSCRIRLKCESTSPFRTCSGDLQQVLSNLLRNAAEAGAREVEVTARDVDEAVEFIVEDDGPGIPVDILPRIFDPFFTTKDVISGSGLGLWISYRIATDLGGTISAANRSVDDAGTPGTRFTLRLPMR
jgi:two-component system NtrC family sensor kinase